MNYNIEESHSLVCLKTFGSCLNICSYSLYMCTRFRRIRIPSIVIQTWFVQNFVPAVITLKKTKTHNLHKHPSQWVSKHLCNGRQKSCFSSLFPVLDSSSHVRAPLRVVLTPLFGRVKLRELRKVVSHQGPASSRCYRPPGLQPPKSGRSHAPPQLSTSEVGQLHDWSPQVGSGRRPPAPWF